MLNSKNYSDVLLAAFIGIFVIGLIYYKAQPSPATSAENPSVAPIIIWGAVMLSLCGASALFRIYYLFKHNPEDKLYHFYPLLISSLPFLFYWNM
jgi:hypothetical protein